MEMENLGTQIETQKQALPTEYMRWKRESKALKT